MEVVARAFSEHVTAEVKLKCAAADFAAYTELAVRSAFLGRIGAGLSFYGHNKMKRRSLLQAALAFAATAVLSGNTSYRQWHALRANHWLIGAARDDAEATRLAEAVANLLAARVPQSQAMRAEAENDRDVVQLLRTRQLELAVMTIDAANDALTGSLGPVYEPAIPIRTVAPFGPQLLVALQDFSTDKAARIAAALAGFRWRDGSAPTRRSGPQSIVPLHAGAIRFKQARDIYQSQ